MSKSNLTLGYLSLTDSLPLIAAREYGFFAEESIEVTLSREVSWANIRDKLIVGHLDAAQMLAPMLFASSLGLGGIRKSLETAFSLGLNGNGITVSSGLFEHMRECAPDFDRTEEPAIRAARALARVVQQRNHADQDKLVFAIVFPYSCHYYQLRHWFARADIDADKHVRFVVLPPTQMVDNLRLGHIDGFCVGEPWNSKALADGAGYCVASGHEIWPYGPEKVLGVAAEWLVQHQSQHRGLLRALYRAASWIDQHRVQAVDLLTNEIQSASRLEWLGASMLTGLPVGIEQHIRGPEYWHVFSEHHANYPSPAHARFLLQQMQRWRQIPEGVDIAIATRAYRYDLYRQVLAELATVPYDFIDAPEGPIGLI